MDLQLKYCKERRSIRWTSHDRHRAATITSPAPLVRRYRLVWHRYACASHAEGAFACRQGRCQRRHHRLQDRRPRCRPGERPPERKSETTRSRSAFRVPLEISSLGSRPGQGQGFHDETLPQEVRNSPISAPCAAAFPPMKITQMYRVRGETRSSEQDALKKVWNRSGGVPGKARRCIEGRASRSRDELGSSPLLAVSVRIQAAVPAAFYFWRRSGARVASQSFILGVVEGLTEFLPIVDRTLILVGDLLGFPMRRQKVSVRDQNRRDVPPSSGYRSGSGECWQACATDAPRNVFALNSCRFHSARCWARVQS